MPQGAREGMDQPSQSPSPPRARSPSACRCAERFETRAGPAPNHTRPEPKARHIHPLLSPFQSRGISALAFKAAGALGSAAVGAADMAGRGAEELVEGGATGLLEGALGRVASLEDKATKGAAVLRSSM